MAYPDIEECGPKEGGRKVRIRAEGAIDVTRKFRVDTRDGTLAVKHPDLPIPGDPAPNLPKAIAREMSTGYKADEDNVIVTVQYTSEKRGTDHTHQAGDVVWDYDASLVQEKVTIDLDGEPIGQNGEGVQRLVPQIVLHYSIWYDEEQVGVSDDPDADTIHPGLYIARTNETEFAGILKDKFLCTKTRWREVRDGVHRIDWDFQKNDSEGGWQHVWYEKEVVEVTLDSGKKVKQKRLITDGSGDGISHTSQIYERAEFNDILI